jgi:DNA gyrase subunit B
MTNKPHEYDPSSIKILKGLTAVRVRPSMFIGDTEKRGLHHLVWEILDNNIDEAMCGFCNQIRIILHADGETITLQDNGRGIPVGIHPDYIKEKKTALEIVMTVLHAGGKFDNDNYAGGSGGLHGVGVSCVNALSDKLLAKVWRDGGIFEQTYSQGNPTSECIRTGDSNKTGTSITFHADKEIFPHGVKFDEELLIRKFRETAFLNAGLKIIYKNEKTNKIEEFQYDG